MIFLMGTHTVGVGNGRSPELDWFGSRFPPIRAAKGRLHAKSFVRDPWTDMMGNPRWVELRQMIFCKHTKSAKSIIRQLGIIAPALGLLLNGFTLT
jgi:hypothetical protein